MFSRRTFSALLGSVALAPLSGHTFAQTPAPSDVRPNDPLPEWVAPLRQKLEAMALELTRTVIGWKGPKRTLKPEKFGHKAGDALSTLAIQKAIDECAKKGGGTVLLSKGDYISGTIDLKSNIRLEVAEGARLLGSTNLADYPERLPARLTVMDSNMGMNQSLIFALDCKNVSLAGKGVIDFRGTKTNFPGKQTVGATPGRPFGIRMLDCQKVHIVDITLKDAACWMQNYLNCEDLLVERITVHNQANHNNDALDIDSCRRVIVRDCLLNSEDDAMCFKGAGQLPTENVLVENCRFYSTCNAIKFGTDSQGDFKNVLVRNIECGGPPENMPALRRKRADSGISWEIVDGGTLEDVYAHDIRIERAESPLFIRLGDRARVRPGQKRPAPGTIKRVVFEKIEGSLNGARGSYFIGISDKSISDVVLKDVTIEMAGSTKPALDDQAIPEMRSNYPDAWMIHGLAPAYGLWTRDVERLSLFNTRFTTKTPDLRPEVKHTVRLPK